MIKVKSSEEMSENFVLSVFKASLNIEKHMEKSGISEPHALSMKYALSMIISSGVPKNRVLRLIDKIIERATEIKTEVQKLDF